MLKPQTLFRGQYEICRRLGSGGMGAVYEVIDRKTERHMALKLMLPGFLDDSDARARFGLETVILAKVESEHVVHVTDAGVDEETDCPYFVMELLRGDTLAAALEQGPLEQARAFRLLEQLSRALEKTHARQIVHRDLKPENLFLVELSDKTELLKVLDFGIARLAHRPGARTTLCMGTPFYMAPEQISGDRDLDERADLYSFAQVAFTLLVGKPYYDVLCGDGTPHHELLLRVMAGPVSSPTVLARERGVTLPHGFDGWFKKAAHRDKDQRFSSAREQIEALERLFLAPPPRFSHLLGLWQSAVSVTAPAHGSFSLRAQRGNTGSVRGRTGAAMALSLVLLMAAVVEQKANDAPNLGELMSSTSTDRLSLPPDSIVENNQTTDELLRAQRDHSEEKGTSTSPSDLLADDAGNAAFESTRSFGTSQPFEVAQTVKRKDERILPSVFMKAAFEDSQVDPVTDLGSLEEGGACSLPFTIDAHGIKHFKPECLDKAVACEMPYRLDKNGVKRFRPECVGFNR